MSRLLQLVMIVKNSGKDIIDMLNVNKEFIDHWTILDTGSTDGTQQRIKEILKDVPGNLYEEPFVDFSVSRNRALELAGTKCEWNIMLDDTYEIRKGKELRQFLKKKTKKFTSLTIIIEDDAQKYPSLRISRSKFNFKYVNRIHEYLKTDASKSGFIDFEISYLYDKKSSYMAGRSMQRYNFDYKILKEDFELYSHMFLVLTPSMYKFL